MPDNIWATDYKDAGASNDEGAHGIRKDGEVKASGIDHSQTEATARRRRMDREESAR
jgi:hypothetical protein